MACADLSKIGCLLLIEFNFKNMNIEFRAWDESQNYMAYQGTPDLETISSFIHHFGDKD